MIKDIERPEVKDIIVAVILEEEDWNVYLVNHKNIPIEGVLVTSKGYGNINDESRKTSVLRQFFEKIPPRSYVKIEPIMEELFGLTNEYWVSFYIGKTIYDKKFIFLPETISPENFTLIPVLKTNGVMIK
jgi:hypothetical protein